MASWWRSIAGGTVVAREAGGIYLFDTREHAQRYLDMHAQRLTQAGVRNIRSRIYAVNAALTAINQGPVA